MSLTETSPLKVFRENSESITGENPFAAEQRATLSLVDNEHTLDQNLDEDDPDIVHSQNLDVGALVMQSSFGGNLPAAIERMHATKVAIANYNGEYSISNGPGAIRVLNGFEVDANGKIVGDEGEDNDSIEGMREAADNATEALEKSRKEWDAQMSDEIPGMTQGEVLSTLKKINANPKKYADQAVKNGLIKDGEQDEFEEYMKLWEKSEEYKRDHNGKSDPALEAELDAQRKAHPTFADAGKVVVKDEATFEARINLGQENKKTTLSDYAESRYKDDGGNSYATNFYGDAVQKRTSSVRDPAFASAPELTEHFEAAKANTVKPEVNTIPPKPQIAAAISQSNDAMF